MLYLMKFIFIIKENTIHKKQAMGASTSSIIYEIHLQYLEHTYTVDKLIKYGIIGYFRCVDDILIVYSLTNTNDEKL